MKRTLTAFLTIVLGLAPVSAQQRVFSLQQCKELSSQADVNLLNADLDLLSAKAQKQEAIAAYFPSVSATVVAYHALYPLIDIGVTDILGTSDYAWNISNYVDETAPQYGLPTRYQTMLYGYGATVSVMQPLFAGGRIINGNRLASFGVEAASLQRSIQERKTDNEIEEKYWRLVSLQEKQKTITVAMETLDTLLKDATSAFAAGLLTEADMTQVKLRKSEIQSTSIKLRAGLTLAKMDMFNSIGVDYSVTEAIADQDKPFIDNMVMADDLSSLESPETLYVPEEQIAASMQETKLLDLQVKAKELLRKMAIGEAMPEVGVGGLYGYGQYIGDGHTNGALYAMVKIPISDWGKTSRKAQRLGYEVQKARNQQAYLDAQIVLLARQSWVSLTTSWDQLQVTKESYGYASDSYHRQEAQFKAGLVTMSELLMSEASMRKAEDAYLDSCMDYRKAVNTYLNLCPDK